MKTLILVLILVITSGCASNYHKFSEIRGLENSVNVPLQNNVDIREEDNDKKLY